MPENIKTYTPVEPGYYKCRVVFVDEKKIFVNGNAVESKHTILRVSVVPTSEDRSGKPCPDDVQVYSFDLPLMYDPSENWRFWDSMANTSVERKPTAKDTEAAIKKAREAIPDWDKFITERAQNHSEVFGWFWGDEFRNTELICKLKAPRKYTTNNGEEKVAYDAQLMSPKNKGMTAAAWTANREKLAKAFIKLPSKGSASAPSAPALSTPPTPPAPKKAPKPVATYEKAWEAYCTKGLPPEEWWNLASDATSKDTATYTAWTPSDWQKVIDRIGTITMF